MVPVHTEFGGGSLGWSATNPVGRRSAVQRCTESLTHLAANWQQISKNGLIRASGDAAHLALTLNVRKTRFRVSYVYPGRGLGEVLLSFPTEELILNYRLAQPPWSGE